MREIVFDTETTGLDPSTGDRLVEIGCIELFNRFPTGNTFHRYINPERDMPEGAFKVHGLSIEFLSDKPLFVHVVEELVEFLGDAPLVAHNAMFDLGFLNAELKRAGREIVARERLAELRHVILELEAQLAAVEAELVARVKEQVLPKGLGEITVVSLDGEVCDWFRFHNRKAIGSYTGCCPGEHSSGGKRLLGSIDRMGNANILAWHHFARGG